MGGEGENAQETKSLPSCVMKLLEDFKQETVMVGFIVLKD